MNVKSAEFSLQEWDLLFYIASYTEVYEAPPPKAALLAAGMPCDVVEKFLADGLLQEHDGQLRVVLERLSMMMCSGSSCV